MKRMVPFISFLVVLFLQEPQCLEAQITEEAVDYPFVGKACPDFTLDDVQYYGSKKVSLMDFTGKWLVLDFWTKGCVVCVQSFPKVNQLQHDFKNQIEFLLVGKNDNGDDIEIRQMYDKFRVKQNLNLPVAYDSILFSRFGIRTTPHIIIVDPKGVVYAITSSEDLTQENLEALVRGKNPYFRKKMNSFEEISTRHNPAGDLFSRDDENIFSSFLKKWNKNTPGRILTQIDQAEHGKFQVSGISLSRLYKIAYFGDSDWNYTDSLYATTWREPILELDDPTSFHCNIKTGSGCYDYSLTVPKSSATRDYLMWSIQCDLKKCFQYDVSIEIRLMPYWSLERSVKQMSPATHDVSKISGDHGGYMFRNSSVQTILKVIWSYHQLEPPFVDATGITAGIDMEIEALMTDLNDVKRALKENNLLLIRRYRKMKVLVIHDNNSL